MQNEAPTPEYIPIAHGKQATDDSTRVTFDAVPAAHSKHIAEPVAEENVPAWQPLQALVPAGEKWPTGHPTQPVESMAPVLIENLPATQPMHAAVPRSVAKKPAAQLAQAAAPSREKRPAAHDSQEIAPAPGPYVPEGQLAQLL